MQENTKADQQLPGSSKIMHRVILLLLCAEAQSSQCPDELLERLRIRFHVVVVEWSLILFCPELGNIMEDGFQHWKVREGLVAHLASLNPIFKNSSVGTDGLLRNFFLRTRPGEHRS